MLLAETGFGRSAARYGTDEASRGRSPLKQDGRSLAVRGARLEVDGAKMKTLNWTSRPWKDIPRRMIYQGEGVELGFQVIEQDEGGRCGLWYFVPFGVSGFHGNFDSFKEAAARAEELDARHAALRCAPTPPKCSASTDAHHVRSGASGIGDAGTTSKIGGVS